MTIKPDVIDWIETAAGVRPGSVGVISLINLIDASDREEVIRQRLLSQAREAIERDVGVIQVGQEFEVKGLSDFLGRSFTMASISSDPNEEFDTGHDARKLEAGLPPEQFHQLMVAQSVISKQSQILQTAVSKATRKKLFTDRQIADAIWEPLKRRKLIPENAVPDRFSEVSRTFDESSKAYETRLVAFTEALPAQQDVLDKLGIAKDLFAAGGAITGAVLGDLRLLKSGLVDDPNRVAAILAGVQVGINSSFEVAQTLVEARGEGKLSDPDTVLKVCKQVVMATQSAVTAGFAGKDEAGQAIGLAISTGVGLATNSVSIAVKIKKGDYTGILADIGDMVKASFAIYAANLKAEDLRAGKEEEDPTPPLTPEELGTVIGNAIKASGALLKSLSNPTPEAFREALMVVIKGATEAGSNYLATRKSDPEIEARAKERDMATLRKQHPKATNDELDTRYKEVKEDPFSETSLAKDVIEPGYEALRRGVDDGSEGIGEKIAALSSKSPEELAESMASDPLLKDLAERLKAQAEEVQSAGVAMFKEELAQDDKDFRSLLNRAETRDGEEDVEKIEALIMKLRKDQVMLDLAFQMTGMSAQVVAAFLPQAGIAVSAIELVKNLTKAAEHYRAYSEWQDNVADARAAMSVQMEAMTNRMDLSRGQTAEAGVKALEAAARLVAGAVSLAGPFAPAGHVIGATLGGVTAAKDLVLKYYRARELKKAWELFLKARANPDDRKLTRKALRDNPTLAKYAIAYGAEVDGNPVARNAMRKCGLSNDVLDSKGANVDKVVAFLEALYPEDPVLLQALDIPAAWHPGPVEFSGKSFAKFAGAASTVAKPKLNIALAKPLTLSFVHWEKVAKAYQKTYDDWMVANTALEKITALPDAEVFAKAEAGTFAALHAMQHAGEAVLSSVSALSGKLGMRTLMVTVDGEPHEEMQDYLGHLGTVALRLKMKYQREIGVMALQKGALEDNERVGLVT